jgi:hypothetical protein
MAENEKRWEAQANKLLKGRRIVGVRFMTAEEAEDSGFMSRPPVIVLDNGVAIFPMADDEGNDAGALATTSKDLPTIPVFQ